MLVSGVSLPSILDQYQSLRTQLARNLLAGTLDVTSVVPIDPYCDYRLGTGRLTSAYRCRTCRQLSALMDLSAVEPKLRLDGIEIFLRRITGPTWTEVRGRTVVADPGTADFLVMLILEYHFNNLGLPHIDPRLAAVGCRGSRAEVRRRRTSAVYARGDVEDQLDVLADELATLTLSAQSFEVTVLARPCAYRYRQREIRSAVTVVLTGCTQASCSNQGVRIYGPIRTPILTRDQLRLYLDQSLP